MNSCINVTNPLGPIQEAEILDPTTLSLLPLLFKGLTEANVIAISYSQVKLMLRSFIS